MSYEQHIKHCKNHHKDRYFQQCSGYFGNNSVEEIDKDYRSEHKTIAFVIVDIHKNIVFWFDNAENWIEFQKITIKYKGNKNYYLAELCQNGEIIHLISCDNPNVYGGNYGNIQRY